MNWTEIFFNGWPPIIRTVAVAGLAYSGLILSLRIVGKRSLAKLNMFDFVVTVALGSTLATILLNKDVALAEGMTAFAMLLGLQWVVSRLSVGWVPFRRLIRSDPRVLLKDGQLLKGPMHDERITEAELDSVIRNSGYGGRDEIAWAILESDGSFSIIGRKQRGGGDAMQTVPDETSPPES